MYYGLSKEWTGQRFSPADLAVMHIDLQTGYHIVSSMRDTTQAARISGELSAEATKVGIPNYYIANAWHNKRLPYKDFKTYLQSKKSRNSLSAYGDLYQSANAQDSDTVITKMCASVATNKKALDHLRQQGKKGLILTGMYYDACFQHSVLGLASSGFYVAACVDATDCVPDRQDRFATTLSTLGDIVAPGMISVTKMGYVTAALS